MVSDFFCPNTGGVETHIYYLSQCLIKRGHKVIVITHAYGTRKGIRWLSNNLKVYYLPFLVAYNGCILPTVFTTLPWIREILIRENIQILHGHGAFSALAHESMFHACALGVRTVFTDHSLFGFADASSILTNKVLQFSLANCNHVICVSYTSKENTVLRARLPPLNVSVIPNAIDCDSFLPDTDLFYGNTVTVIVVSRLVYRKGTDLLAAIIPELCAKYSKLRFLIAGDGPKRILIEEAREKHGLHDRVIMCGTLPHTQVRDVLIQGQIFLNTSLTEAFCMAIVEAASCGLHVVTTKVGGIPEVLPSDMTVFAEPNAKALSTAVEEAILKVKDSLLPDPNIQHKRVRQMYVWTDVAQRTEMVYKKILQKSNPSTGFKLKRFFRCGLGFGWLFITVAAINILILKILEIFRPQNNINIASDSPYKYNHNKAGGDFESKAKNNHKIS